MLLSYMIQSIGSNEEFAYGQHLAVGARNVYQQTIPHAGFYIHCVQKRAPFYFSLSLSFSFIVNRFQ